MKIDLCAAVGAGFGPYRLGEDEAIMEVVSSVYVACGFHAGDPVIMDKTVRLALARRIAIGAHVGLPDMMGFGRRAMSLDPDDAARYVAYQMGGLEGIAKAAGGRMTLVSLHGALDNMASRSFELAEAIVKMVAAYNRDLVIRVTTNGAVEQVANDLGVETAVSFLPDRTYTSDGRLVPRGTEGSLVGAPTTVLERVQQFLHDGTVTAVDGQKVKLNADSIFLRSDSPTVINMARIIRAAIEARGGHIGTGPFLVHSSPMTDQPGVRIV